MTLRLISYNILAGGEQRLPLIASIIGQQQADIVALQEARSRSNAESLAHQLGMSFTLGEAYNTNKDHVVWLSRLPVIHAENHPFPILAKTLLEIEVLWQGKPLALFTTHLKAGQDVESEQRRIAEMQAILSLLQSHHNPLQVLAGDFNTIHPADRPNISAYVAVLKARDEKAPAPQFPRRVIPLLLQAGYVDCYRTLHPLPQKRLFQHLCHTSQRAIFSERETPGGLLTIFRSGPSSERGTSRRTEENESPVKHSREDVSQVKAMNRRRKR